MNDDLLRRMKPGEHIVLTREMLAEDDPVAGLDVNVALDTEVVEPQVSLKELSVVAERIMEKYEVGDATMDREMAVLVHDALPITRRMASDRTIWHYLGAVRFPDFVCHRFAKQKNQDGVYRRAQERFLGDRVRNTFGRLWWAAELTRAEDGSYDLTRRLVESAGFQDAYEAIFGRAFSAYRPALEAFIDVMRERRGPVIRDTAVELGHVLTTLVLESRESGELRTLIAELADAVER